MTNQNAFLEKLRVIVIEHYTEEQFGVSELVAQFGMSRSQMHRKLKSATGQSISQFIREIRLDESLKLLQAEDTTASEVAYKVGFNSPTYFNTCFNEYFGYPPGEAKLQMELAHSNSISAASNSVKTHSSRRNPRVLLWLLIITAIVVSLFVYKYMSQEGVTSVAISEEKEKSIAVLPLKNWSGDLELEYVSDGMTDAIISKLAEIKGMDRVIPFTTMVLYKDTQLDLQEIAKELNVEYVLEGNFKLAGEEVRSSLKLIEAGTLEQLWSLEHKGLWKIDEIFEMQAAVAENVSRSMSVNIASNELDGLQYQPTTSEKAYRSYLKAEHQVNKLSEFGLNNSIGLFEEAIAVDSTYVEAYIGLGTVYLISGAVWGIIPQDEAWRKAKPLFETAMKLDSLATGRNLEEIKGQLHGGYFYYELDIKKSEERYAEISENLDSWNSTNLFDYFRKTGRFDLAIKNIEDDIANNPTDGLEYMQKAFILFVQGNTEEAKELLEIYDPLYRDSYFYLLETSKWYYYMDEIEKSKKHLEQLLEQHGDRPPIVYWLIAVHSEMEGDEERLRSSLDILQQQYTDEKSGSPAWFLALYHFHIKDVDTAFAWLQKSWDRREVEMTWLKEEPMLQAFREDPRYIELYEKMGFQYLPKKFLD